ncbi:MAG: hypothetical protein NT089_00410 [Planctomycetia bacterium]|nr:hypothetical protein [Planctomycetia bacterium]
MPEPAPCSGLRLERMHSMWCVESGKARAVGAGSRGSIEERSKSDRGALGRCGPDETFAAPELADTRKANAL